jgi:hypothetical protein
VVAARRALRVANADPFLWAGINGDGEWLVGRITDGSLTVTARGDIPSIRRHDIPVGAPYPWRVTLECATDPVGGGDRASLWVEDVLAADLVDQRVGPYRSAGLVAASDGPGFAIFFDDVVIDHADAAAAPSGSPVPSSSGTP